jgi:hypothetical protein
MGLRTWPTSISSGWRDPLEVGHPDFQSVVRWPRSQAGGWSLSDRVDLQPGYGLKKGGWRLVALQFTVEKGAGDSDVRVDDILVDPRARF